MQKLMLGNQAVARGAYEAGVTVAAAYPGTPSTEILEYVSGYDGIYSEWSPNEKVALEVAAGASIAGARALCAMKHVGLNVAADPLFTVSYTGVNAGLVVAVADDPGMHSSQNEQDSRHYALSSKIPMLEPSDSRECLSFTRLAYQISEEFDCPVLLRLTTRISHSQSIVEIIDNPVSPVLREYTKNPGKYVMMPAMARKRHPIVEERMKALSSYSDNCGLNKIEWGRKDIGIIAGGIAWQYAKEAIKDASFLKLGMIHPLPANLIREFAQGVEKLFVIEELDPFIETFVKELGIDVTGKDLFTITGEFNTTIIRKALSQYLIDKDLTKSSEFSVTDKNKCNVLEKPAEVSYNSRTPLCANMAEVSTNTKSQADTAEFSIKPEDIPVRPPVMCPGCPHRGLFHILKKLKLTVSGDIGCYTLGALPPSEAMDTCICMGASVSAVHGMDKARGREFSSKSVGILGDSTFIHSGITGLIDIVYNKGTSTIIILDNSITGMTGHQHNPTTGYTIKGEQTAQVDLEKLCYAIGIERVETVDPFDLVTLEKTIKEEISADAPSVIITRRPCALLKGVRFDGVLEINKEKCKKCKRCLSIGCPAIISEVDGTVAINSAICVGCGLCRRLCNFEAIGKKNEAGDVT